MCTASNSDGSAEAWSDVVVTGTVLQPNHFSNTLDSSKTEIPFILEGRTQNALYKVGGGGRGVSDKYKIL